MTQNKNTKDLVKTGFSEATRQRRSLRALTASSPVSDSTISQLAESALAHVPSAFNSQTTRITILFGAEHKKLWSLTASTLIPEIGEELWTSTFKAKVDGYAAAHGTILFWDDSSAEREMRENAPKIYKDKTSDWTHQSNGMHQYYMWVALEAMGLGVNLQHYNPMIDAEVRRTWGVPREWCLSAQMVFGTPIKGSTPPAKVQKTPVRERLMIFGASSSM